MQSITTILPPQYRAATRRSTRVALTLAAILGICAPAIGQVPLLTPHIDDPARRTAIVEYPDAPGWLFFRTPSYCYASLENTHGRLLVGYNRARDEMHLGVWGDTARTYADGTRLTGQIVMWDYRPHGRFSKPIYYWDELPVVVFVNTALHAVFNFKLAGRNALASFRKHATVSFVGADGETWQAFDLAFSATALRRLETCDPR